MSVASSSTGVDRPRRSALDRVTARRFAVTEYQRFADLLAILTPAHWALPTCCPGWDVRAMAGHVVGMAEMAASASEFARQQLAAVRRSGFRAGPQQLLDGLTAVQVAKNDHLTIEELVAAARAVGPRAVRARFGIPRPW